MSRTFRAFTLRALSVMLCRFHNAHEQPAKLIIARAVTHLPAKYEEEGEKWCVCDLTEPDSYFTVPSSQIHSLHSYSSNWFSSPSPKNYAVILHLTKIPTLLFLCLHIWMYTRNVVLKIYWNWKYVIVSSFKWMKLPKWRIVHFAERDQTRVSKNIQSFNHS